MVGIQGYSGSRLARVGAPNDDTSLLVALARGRLRTLVEATERAWGGARLAERLVVCDGPEFEELFPDHLWWIDRVDPEWRADPSMAPWPLELLGVAATWPSTNTPVHGDVPAAGDDVVALHAPRIVQASEALSVSVAGLFDAIVTHEYSHHADGVLTQRQAGLDTDVARAEHVAQLQAWNALTLLPGPDGDVAKQAMLGLSKQQPRPYTTFVDLPMVAATLPVDDDLDDPLLVPVNAFGYPELDAKSRIDVAGSQRLPDTTPDALGKAGTSIVVLVNWHEQEVGRRWGLFAHGQLSGDEREQLIRSDALENPAEGVQLAIGPYRVLDARGQTLRLAPVDGHPPRRMRYAYTTSGGPLAVPRQKSACGGQLLEV